MKYVFASLVTLYLASLLPAPSAYAANKDDSELEPCFQWIKEYQSKNKYVDRLNSISSFDVNWDNNFTCSLGVNSETVQEKINAFQKAVIFPDEINIKAGVNFPLQINGSFSNPNIKTERSINDWKEFLEFRNEALNENHIALISCASVKSLTIIPDDGAMLGNGFIWFQSRKDGFGPWVINAQGVSENDILTTCKKNF